MYQILEIAKSAKKASRAIAVLDSSRKNAFLFSLAEKLSEQKSNILVANALDVEASKINHATKAFIDRLTLSESRLSALSQAVKDIAELPDPVGTILESQILPNKLSIKKVSVPFGCILMVYESRPNVTIDAAALCIKSGNTVILKGGKEALNTNQLFCSLMKDCLKECQLPEDAVTLITNSERSYLYELLKLEKEIDLVIPRGGESLVSAIAEHSRIPVLKNAKGVCHTFVDESADIDIAISICDNAKTQRPGVCNAMETLLIHKNIAENFLPEFVKVMNFKSVELRGDSRAKSISSDIKEAKEQDWDEEYGDLILAVKIVDNLDNALNHIRLHGSGHSEAIVSSSQTNIQRFLKEVDAAAVYSNASTRFTDGGEFGLGAEIGISTGKLHARGPMGLRELTSYKYIIEGNGQIRT